MKTKHLERIVKGVSNHRRIQILELLGKEPELSVSEIAQKVKIDIKNASQHIHRMAVAGLILKRNQNKNVRHKLSERGKTILQFLKSLEK